MQEELKYLLAYLLHKRHDQLALVENYDFNNPGYEAAAALKESIDWGIRIGYYWAQVETCMRMEPFAIAGLNVRKGAQKAGLSSGRRRREKADEIWKPHALELAQQLRRTDSRLSQHRLAEEITFNWKLNSPPPGHSTLTAFISYCEKAEKLPRRSGA